ncbi:hypothetical protein [Myxococcus stipitatus]|nr:hypothetical protein [Myxococcus stipitatus]
MPIYEDNWNFCGLSIPKPDRLQERSLAVVTIESDGVQEELRRAFGRINAIVGDGFPSADEWRNALSTQGRYGYAYTGYNFWLIEGNFRRRTVLEGIEKIRAKLGVENVVHNEKLYMDIVGVFVGASRLLKRRLAELRERVVANPPQGQEGGLVQEEPPDEVEMPQNNTLEAVGVRNRIENPANRLRKWLPRQRGRNVVYYPDTTVNERFLSVNGPSATTLDMLNFACVIGCPARELRALAWGLFAWWRLHNRPKAYHTFNEAMYVLNDFVGDLQFMSLPRAPDLDGNVARRPPMVPPLPNSLVWRGPAQNHGQ